MLNTGDKLANNPIVHAIGKLTGCIDHETNMLIPKSPCEKARDQLNQGVPLWHVMYDRFFQKPKDKK